MDLLNNNQYEKKQEPKGKKTIMILLIVSIVAVVGIIGLMIYLSSNTVKPDTLFINNQQQKITSEMLVSDNDGNQYIALKDLTNIISYEYYSNEYPKEWEDENKCYIKNGKLITSFEKDTNQIYKYEEGTNLDYQYYTLNCNIIKYNNKLYIALVDLKQALNMVCTKDKDNVIKISTMEYLATQYQEELIKREYTLTTDQNNQKAIPYGWLIVNKNGLWSVLNTNYEEIIGNKYKTIYFDEKNQNYIVSNTNGRYGIISNTGSIVCELKYDNLEILNYENQLYKVKNNNKYGIVKFDGTELTGIIYDGIGYPANPENKILYTLIIPELDGKSGKSIVVMKDKKYGLIYLDTGKEFVPCNEIDRLYATNELGVINYKIEINKNSYDLIQYIEYVNKYILN